MTRLKPFLTPLVVVALTVGAILGGKRILFPPGGGYIVKAEFKDAGGLTKNSDVKIGGVAGGKVKSISLTHHDTALVTMELDKGAFPIGLGASAASRPVNLLGEKYVDLDPGNLDRPQQSGTSIPITRTSRPVELDDVLNMLAPDVRARLRILINEAGISMGGRGTDLNALLEQLPPALDQTKQVVARFSADNQKLASLIDKSDRVLASIGPNDKGLEHLVQSAGDALAVTASRREGLANTVRNTPATLRQLRTTLGTLGNTASGLKPMAVQLRGASPEISSTLRALPQFAKDAKPALSEAKAVSPDLTRLGKQGAPVIDRLRPTSDQLAKFASDLAPVTHSFDTGTMKGVLGLMNGWSRTIRRSDGLGHVFGLNIQFNKELVTDLLDRYVDPVVGSTKKKSSTDAKPNAKAPDAAKTLPGVPTVKKTVTGVLGGVQQAVNGVGQVLKDVTGGVKDATGGVGGVVKGLLGGGQSQGGAQPKSESKTSAAGRLLDYLVGP